MRSVYILEKSLSTTRRVQAQVLRIMSVGDISHYKRVIIKDKYSVNVEKSACLDSRKKTQSWEIPGFIVADVISYCAEYARRPSSSYVPLPSSSSQNIFRVHIIIYTHYYSGISQIPWYLTQMQSTIECNNVIYNT